MKRYITLLTIIGFSALVVGCLPEDSPTLDNRITDIKIIAMPGELQNTFRLQADRKDIIGFWDLGNGIKVDAANEVLAEYPFSGNYTVTLTGYSNGGRSNTTSMVVAVPKNNFELLSDPIYELLSGTIGDPDGKTWVMDSMLYAHMTNLNLNDMNALPNNTAIPVNATAFPNLRSGELRMGKTLYDDEATFVLSTADGQAFKYTNNGSSLVTNTGSNGFKDQTFIKAKSWQPGAALSCAGIALPSGFTGGYNGDWQITCTPPSGMTWLVSKGGDGKYTLKFPDVSNGPGGFLFFALDWLSTYEILSITADRMVVQKQTMSGAELKSRSVRRLVIIRKGSPSGLPLTSIPEEGSLI